MLNRFRVCLAILVVAAILPSTEAHAQSFVNGLSITVREMGPVDNDPNTDVQPVDINDKGEVAAVCWLGCGSVQPVFWDQAGGYKQFLPAGSSGSPTSLNNLGQVVGTWQVPPAADRGFLWSRRGGFRDLGPSFLPRAINGHGDMVGLCLDKDAHACVILGGLRLTVPPACDGCAGAQFFDINDEGAVAGYAQLAKGQSQRAVIWTEPGGYTLTAAQASSAFNAINNHGDAAGALYGGTRAAVLAYAGGRWIVGHEDPQAALIPADINDSGMMAGGRSLATSTRAVVWPKPDRAAVELTIPHDATFSEADAINNRGQIAGFFWTPSGAHAAIWTVTLRDLHIETPNTSSRWGVGSTQRLAWTYTGHAADFQIDISRDSGRTWETLTTVGNTSGLSQNYDWRVSGPLTSAAKFRVSAVGDPAATDVNDADIRIVNPTIEVLQPTGTTSVTYGTRLAIVFKHSLGVAKVAVETSSDNGATWRTIANTTTTGSTTSTFKWTVDLTPNPRARVRIRALDGTGITGMSAAFAVTAANPGAGGNTDDGTTVLP